MRLNANTKIVGQRVILVPYEAKHVEKYHQWMQSKELQELTASEPLTLDEEYAMQRTWREDDDKCTFLVLCRETYEATADEIAALVGDTNLFLQMEDSEEAVPHGGIIAEAEIMIAEPTMRGKRYGWEAMLLMFQYALDKLNVRKFIAKIGMNNAKSMKMFEKMKFHEVARLEVFREVTYERVVDKQWVQWLKEQVQFEYAAY